jgi:hypothetical protein
MGPCKRLFQNWLVKNPYYVVSRSASEAMSNRGAAATNAAAFIADYLKDRDDVVIVHRNAPDVNGGQDQLFTPAEAFAFANQTAIDRMNGYGVERASSRACDFLSGTQQSPQWGAVKSQIRENGVIPEEARRDQYCNIAKYDDSYQNYPQLHVGNNVQQCELMLRRGDRSCYDNVDPTDLPAYEFEGPDGAPRTTHLRPGRGSLERAIRAVIVDAQAEWRHDAALDVAYRYYFHYRRLRGFGAWLEHLDRPDTCWQDICFGTLTHGMALADNPLLGYDAGADALLVEVDRDDGEAVVPLSHAVCPADPVNRVTGVGVVTGLAYDQGRLYGIERDVDGDHHLFLMAPSLCAEGTRVGGSPIGFDGLDSLAACPDGTLYSVDWNAVARRGRLLRIDPATGAGEAVGPAQMASDVRVVGLACDREGTLFALGAGEGARFAELLVVDRTTGVESVVGGTGTAAEALQSLEVDRESAAPRLLAGGATLHEIDPLTGSATPIGGGFAGLLAMAMPEPGSWLDSDDDRVPDPRDNCRDVANTDQLDLDLDGYGSACDADYNNDGVVGAPDLFLFWPSFGASEGEVGFLAAADHNGDGVVGLPDLFYLLRTFGQQVGPSGLACAGQVPCPLP